MREGAKSHLEHARQLVHICGPARRDDVSGRRHDIGTDDISSERIGSGTHPQLKPKGTRLQ